MKAVSFLTSLFCMIATSVFAENKTFYVAASCGLASTAVSLRQDGDYVSMPLTINSDQKEPEACFAEIRAAQELIVSKAGQQSGIEIHKGPISLSPTPVSKMSYSSYPSPSSAQMNVLTKLGEKEDVYTCALRIREFLDGIRMPGKSSRHLGQIELVTANPDQYRQKILTMIFKDVVFVKSIVQNAGKVSITGLEGPVLVRQMDDRKVELFINYSMTIELANNSIESDDKQEK